MVEKFLIDRMKESIEIQTSRSIRTNDCVRQIGFKKISTSEFSCVKKDLWKRGTVRNVIFRCDGDYSGSLEKKKKKIENSPRPVIDNSKKIPTITTELWNASHRMIEVAIRGKKGAGISRC